MNIEYIKIEIKRRLADLDHDVEVVEVEKLQNNGGKRKGFSIRETNMTIAPNIYYDEADTDDDIISHIVFTYTLMNHKQQEKDNAVIRDFFSRLETADDIYDRAFPVLINKEKNAEMLKQVMWTPFLTLAVIYKMEVPEIGFIAINNSLAEHFGVDADILYEKAVDNVGKDYRINDLNDEMIRLAQKMGADIKAEDLPQIPQGTPRLHILTNKGGCYGAAVILSPKVMEAVHDVLGTDEVYILPSSIHDVIAVPIFGTDDELDTDELREMVREANSQALSTQDILDDKVYIHTANGILREVQ